MHIIILNTLTTVLLITVAEFINLLYLAKSNKRDIILIVSVAITNNAMLSSGILLCMNLMNVYITCTID